ncbi:MAG TPA: YfhO family protein [Acidimicrobiales bacterium]|nr:YfhO family protein [Acidimicrobiales bacterium]
MPVATGGGRATPVRRERVALTAGFALLAVAVVVFTAGWSQGDPPIDGPGESLWLGLLLDYWHAGHGIPAWIPDMWAGSPVWHLFPVFHLVFLFPLAEVFGPEQAVKVGVLAAQIAGAWGAAVLARSLWSRTGPAVVAGLVYGLHPFFASHGALSGHEPSVWVLAAAPWLAWSFRLALRQQGSRYVVVAGLLAGFAVLQQAELAYSLVLLCGLLLALELARARRVESAPAWPRVLRRAGAVVLIGLGTTAHWLLPFLATSESFVLTPPREVEAGLAVLSGALGREPDAFLRRAAPLGRTYDFDRLLDEAIEMEGVHASSFYLSGVALLVTLFTVVWLARHRDDDGTLSAVLLASAAGVWLSMGTEPLASGGLARGSRVLAVALVGAVAGLLVGNVVSRVQSRRRPGTPAIVAAAFLVALPFLPPFGVVQRLVPFLSSIRFPRFYVLAALGLALGAAYPLTLVQRWAASRPRPDRASLLGAAACTVVAAAFLVDVAPYRSYYRARPPEGTQAYARAARTLGAAGGDSRVAVSFFSNPRPSAVLLAAGRSVSTGWPHPMAGKDLWRLTAETMDAPSRYRNAALGLSSTSFVATERLSAGDDPVRTVDELRLEPNPRVLPMVRAYDDVVVVRDGSITPELAVAWAGRSVGTVRGGSREVAALGEAVTGVVDSARACEDPGAGDDPSLAGDVAVACALHAWIGTGPGLGAALVGAGPGARFRSSAAGLRGVAVWLDRAPAGLELVLHELGSDGVSVGREVRRAGPDHVDANGLVRFSFDPVAESEGRRYLFRLSCADCTRADEPLMIVADDPRTPGTLVVGDRIHRGRAAAFAPVYDRRPAAAPSAAQLRASRPGPGRWRIDVQGSRPSVVVVAESYFPGWTAKVDGREVPVVEADGAFLGVPVGPGQHRVTLEYHSSPAVAAGYVVTGVTLLLCLVVPLLLRLRSRPRREAFPVLSDE